MQFSKHTSYSIDTAKFFQRIDRIYDQLKCKYKTKHLSQNCLNYHDMSSLISVNLFRTFPSLCSLLLKASKKAWETTRKLASTH